MKSAGVYHGTYFAPSLVSGSSDDMQNKKNTRRRVCTVLQEKTRYIFTAVYREDAALQNGNTSSVYW